MKYIILSFLILGCADERHTPIDPHSSVCINDGFTIDQIDSLSQSSLDWKEATNGGANLHLYLSKGMCDVDVVATQPHDNASGSTTHLGDLIKIRPTLEGRELKMVVLHEFGHLLTGGSHSTDPHDIMFNHVPTEEDNPDGHLTANDIARFDPNAWENTGSRIILLF